MTLTTKAKFTAYESGVTGPKLITKTFINTGVLAPLSKAQFDAVILEIQKIGTIKHIAPFEDGVSTSVIVFYEGEDIGSGDDLNGIGMDYGNSFLPNGGIDLSVIIGP